TALQDVCVDVAFVGTNGLSLGRGLTTPDQSEAAAKRAMVAAGRRVVLVTGSTKVGDDHFHRFASVEDLDLLITDTDLDDDTAVELAAAGPEVARA
ncbi:MAG TPA: D-beta-D-heptose 1-phosphate adenosyltransferase, partial [Ornithinibacter sp.]|nr:D-beta-D-heptose 1-phosphate adenosyltransferase [Ornithinibacter sp.]